LRKFALIVGLILVPGFYTGGLLAQDVPGIWQGSLPGSVEERLVLTIARNETGILSAQLFAVDHAQTYGLESITFQTGSLRFII
jgi:hypothetical protein